MQLYVKFLYILVSILALVDQLCLSFSANCLLRTELLWKKLLARVNTMFRSFWCDALYILCKFHLLFFLLSFLKGMMCWQLFSVCQYQGFVSAVGIMRDFVPAIYDTTVIIPKDSPAPTMLRILRGQSSVVSVSTSVDLKCWDVADFDRGNFDWIKWIPFWCQV